MIRDGRRIATGSTLEFDLCVVGAGAAGISIAAEMINSRYAVAVLAGGGTSEHTADRDLYTGYVAPGSAHEPLEENRRRQFGGTTSAWGGRCVPCDDIDFEQREYVPFSGWPFSKEHLDPFYERALKLCEAGEYKYLADQVFPTRSTEIISGFDGRDVVSNRLERWSPPTHFGRRYYRELKDSENVAVFLHTHCVHIRLDAGGTRVRTVDATSPAGNRLSIKARHFVIAAGGLETARLLLSSNDVSTPGIGNHSGALGRFYMSHLMGAFALAKVNDPQDLIYDFEKDPDSVYCRRRFWITPAAQRAHRMLNAVGFFFRHPIGEPDHGSALLSAAFITQFLLGLPARRSLGQAAEILRDSRIQLNAHFRNVTRDFRHVAPCLVRMAKDRFFSKRRLPMVLPPQQGRLLYLFYQTEQAPNPDSRVTLRPERDALGVPRLMVDIRFSDIDVETVLGFHRLIRRQFELTRTGELLYDEAELRAQVEDSLRQFSSKAHHIGTTRMSHDPATGVVNADCRVHHVSNLFIGSSSVFPTSGHANPTLTIVALAIRLADHLKSTMGSLRACMMWITLCAALLEPTT